MVCTLEELRSKDVINVVDGENLGRVDDLEVDAETAAVTALILYGRPRLLGCSDRGITASSDSGRFV